jgi:protocadherin delta 1
VKVLDANDHTPKFSQAVYHVYLSENNVVGATIVKLNATDEDVGKNGALHYSIHPSNISENSTLAVDSVTGMVRALEQFDYEVKRVYEFVITATDHGDIARSATATLLLEIVDTNDEPPVFVGNQPYIFHLLENRPPNYLVGTVTATDADAYPNNQVTYAIDYIDETSLSIGHFNIDSFAGRLYAKLPLDREKTAVHKFRVVASNVGFSHMRTYADVFVHVTDENDNAPTVLFPNKHNRTLRVSPSAPQGAIVGWVEARDPDNGQNGTLSYDVTNLPTQPVFVVSATSGAILVVGDVSELDQHVVRLRIKVTDNGVPPRAAEAETDLWIAVNGSTGQWQAEAALMGSGLLLMGQTEFLVIIAIIVGILMTAVVIATITCCLRGGNRHVKRQQGGGMAVGGGGAKGETDKFLPSKATDDKYSVVVNVNGTNGLLRPHEALAMQRSWRTDPDLELNAIGVSTFTLPQEVSIILVVVLGSYFPSVIC